MVRNEKEKIVVYSVRPFTHKLSLKFNCIVFEIFYFTGEVYDEKESIDVLEKVLLRDLKNMKHRQVIHPVLQAGTYIQVYMAYCL